MDRRKKRKLVPYLFLSPIFILIFAFAIYPLIFMIHVSMLDYNLMYTKFEEAPFVGGRNYVDILTSTFFWKNTMWIQLLYSGSCVLIELILGLALAAIAAEELKGFRVIRLLFILPVLMAPISVGYAWRYMMEPSIGLINYFIRDLLGINLTPMWNTSAYTSMISVILVDVWQWTPFMFLIFLAGIMSLPAEPFEAATIDGASGLQKFRHLTLRMLRPVIIIAVLIRLMDTIKFIDVIYALTTGGPAQTTETFTYAILRETNVKFWISTGSALGLILLIILNIITTILFRYLKWKE